VRAVQAPMPRQYRLQCERRFYLHVTTMYAHFDAGHPDLSILRTLAGAHIETPSMPWALEQVSIQLAFAQRPAGMRTGVIDGKEYSIHIAQRQTDAFNVHGSTGSRRDLVDLSYGDIDGERIHRFLI
jgi:hypothetical protein